MSKHTPGPWYFYQSSFGEFDIAFDGPHGRTELATVRADSEYSGPIPAKANASRIVACVNALEGLDPQGIPYVIERLKEQAEREGGSDWSRVALQLLGVKA